jgi:cyclophilin family peptidyl-prolyl cis-trans isomerase
VRLRTLVAPALVLAAAAFAPGALAASAPHPGADGCDHAKPPGLGAKKPSFAKAGTVVKRGAKAAIVMVTSCGTIRVELALDKSNPIPNSFAFLTTKHYFDGLSIFRDVPAFVLQSGSPNNSSAGGGPGYTVRGPVPMGYSYKLGDVAMAKTELDRSGTGGSQFFVISGSQGRALPTQYGLVGHAADKKSLATIARLASFASSSELPSKPIYIWTATLVRES